MALDYVDRTMDEWSKWIAQLINPEDAEEYGYMFLVKEIDMFEWSPVSFGANELTAFLGVKSGNKDALTLKVFDRLDLLEKQLRSGKQSDMAMLDYELETRQLKQIINEIFNLEPSIKDTLFEQRRLLEDTKRKNLATVICGSCLKSFSYDNQKDISSNGTVKCTSCGQFVSQTGAMVSSLDLSKAIKETNFFTPKFFTQ